MGEFKAACECGALGEFAAVGMGDSQGRDERVLATLETTSEHGGDNWWLYSARCAACGQDWMIAQESRIHDNYYLRRLKTDEATKISNHGIWPPDFLRFEDVIRLGPESGKFAQFFDANDLTDTVKELMEARSDISASEVAYLFVLTERQARRLMDRANRMSWAQLRPFA